jgi:hypothetical protein
MWGRSLNQVTGVKAAEQLGIELAPGLGECIGARDPVVGRKMSLCAVIEWKPLSESKMYTIRAMDSLYMLSSKEVRCFPRWIQALGNLDSTNDSTEE